MRVFLPFALLICLAAAANSQVQIIMRELSCEGESDYEIDLPPCESAWRPSISVVFLGRATDVHKEDVPIIVDGKKELTERFHVIFQVEEAFRGVSEKVVNVVSGGDLCGEDFEKGNRYLVYGRRLSGGEVYVSRSSNTKWVKDFRVADDLKYLRGLRRAAHGGTIYGTVIRYTNPENPDRKEIRRGVPEVGQKIEVQGSNQDYETVVDGHGDFKLSGLPPGRYQIKLSSDSPVSVWRGKSTTVDLADQACSRFYFRIDPFAKKDSMNPEEQGATRGSDRFLAKPPESKDKQDSSSKEHLVSEW